MVVFFTQRALHAAAKKLVPNLEPLSTRVFYRIVSFATQFSETMGDTVVEFLLKVGIAFFT